MTEEKNKSDQFQLPYAVPKGMRTLKFLPRSIAAVLVLSWFTIVAVSSISLAKNDSRTKSPIAKLFSEETSHWGVYLADGTNICDSFLTSRLLSSDDLSPIAGGRAPKLELQVQGLSALRHQETPLLFSTSMRFGFNAYQVLESLEVELAIGDGLLRVSSVPESNSLEVWVDIGAIKTHYPLGNIPPVFLTKRGVDSFDVQIPEDLTRIFDGIASSAQSFQEFRQLNEEQFAQCKTDLANIDTIPLESLLDVSSYFRLLPTHLRQGITQVMTRQALIPSSNLNKTRAKK